MRHTMLISVAGLGADLVGEMPTLSALAGRGVALPLEPVIPALTCPMQATFTTGEPPARHGIVADGLYFHDTAEVRFWEQSAKLLAAPRAWAHDGGPKVAMLFWQLAMYDPSIDVLLTPKPVHGPGGRLIQDCYSKPADLYARLTRELGPFDLMHYWGPAAGIESSRWIARAALEVWQSERPDLLLAYLPHLDYSGHRAGPDSEAHRAAARELDAHLAPLVDAAEADGARAVVLSEYSFVPVGRTVAPNRALREANFAAVREIDGGEYLYPGDSRAFALVDNQVAHIYLPAAEDLPRETRRVRRLLEGLDGVAAVLDRTAMAEAGLDHPRCGELLALAEPDAHFVYSWWTDESRAPAFAPTVDIHAKPGFDPAELFVEPGTGRIPLSAEMVKGSHGLVPEGGRGWGVYLDTEPPKRLADRSAVRAAEVAHLAMAGA
jgi:predicted AlkP superfamily pyrophosphatase or phosphodiesterase